jgi:hypothetical protein
MAASYNGWTASSNPDAIGINRTWEPVPGHRFPGGVKAGDVETVFTYLVRQLDARVEPIEHYPAGDEWGYNYRHNVNNPLSLSCHASGTAIDYNATRHPNRVPYTWTAAQAREIHRILDELDGVIRWLEGFDEMHFEVRGSTTAVRAVADRLRAKPAPPKPIPPPPPPPPVIRRNPDMAYIAQCKGKPTRLKDGPTCPPISEHAKLSALASGIPVVDMQPVDYEWMLKHCSEALGRNIVDAIERL